MSADLVCMLTLAYNVTLLRHDLKEGDPVKASFTCTEAADQLSEVSRLMTDFDKTFTSLTTQLWLMYIYMTMNLKQYIHAERAGL